MDNGQWRRVLLATAVAVLAMMAFCAAAVATPPPGYKLIWSDEFHEGVYAVPNPANWNHETGPGPGNNELEIYVSDWEHAHIVADPGATDGQALQIEATDDVKGYRSARLTTEYKAVFTYGYMEARIRIPHGQGVWPAFWMLGSNMVQPGVGWPNCGEMDIMENIGNDAWLSKIQSSLNGPGYAGGNPLYAQYELPGHKRFTDGYHLFAVLWAKDSVTYYVDGRPFETRTPADTIGQEWVFNHPFYLLANIAVGGDFPGSPNSTTRFPQTMRIDYVRVYQVDQAAIDKRNAAYCIAACIVTLLAILAGNRRRVLTKSL